MTNSACSSPAPGHDGGTNGEVLLGLELVPKGGSADLLEATEGGGGGLKAGRRGTNHRVRAHEREVVHYDVDHLSASSLERRYISAASSGRFRRSSTIPSL